mmetsp:Transcript_73295/g.157032  ORF Transcript_73295/g.157032 Transcript_73295/m.157032 type:complete len:111 (+) Transcript_73295:69-401(+)
MARNLKARRVLLLAVALVAATWSSSSTFIAPPSSASRAEPVGIVAAGLPLLIGEPALARNLGQVDSQEGENAGIYLTLIFALIVLGVSNSVLNVGSGKEGIGGKGGQEKK